MIERRRLCARARPGYTRPTFTYTRDNATGALSVAIPAQFVSVIDKVVLRHSQTVSTIRRDFRWIRGRVLRNGPEDVRWLADPTLRILYGRKARL